MFSKDYIVSEVKRLLPGQSYSFSMKLMDVYEEDYNGVKWRAGDLVLEKIVGSAYEYSYWEDCSNGHLVFERRFKPLELGQGRTYVSPDQRDRFVLGVDKIWRYKGE